MYIVAAFEYSTNLELAISHMEMKGIERKKILAVPLDKKGEKEAFMDTINRSDGISLFDGAMVLGTVFMVLGVVYGYILAWGPIAWGLIGLLTGGVAGFLLDTLLPKKKRKKSKIRGSSPEVVIIINCEKPQKDMIEDVLRKNGALGVGTMDQSQT